MSLVKSLSLSESPFSDLKNESKDTPNHRTVESHWWDRCTGFYKIEGITQRQEILMPCSACLEKHSGISLPYSSHLKVTALPRRQEFEALSLPCEKVTSIYFFFFWSLEWPEGKLSRLLSWVQSLTTNWNSTQKPESTEEWGTGPKSRQKYPPCAFQDPKWHWSLKTHPNNPEGKFNSA